MRTIFFTGRGGAGVSTLAAATAAAIADSGRKTLAFGLGPGLATAFDRPLGDRPAPLVADLWALEAGRGRQDAPGPVLAWLREMFAWRNMDETVADNIAALPGLVDLARLIALDEHIGGGEFEVVVVDGPAARHAVDLLSALDSAARALERVFPEREPTVLDPFLRALVGNSGSGEDVYRGGRDLLLGLSRLRRTLADAESGSVRLVLGADKGSRDEAQRAATALSLFAYPLDAAFCNRIVPRDAGDWSRARRKDQRAALAQVSESLAPLPVLSVPLRRRDVAGAEGLVALAREAYGEADPAAVLHRGPTQAFSRRDGRYILSLSLPFVEREELAIERLDDALIVYVGDRSRTFDLPAQVRDLDGVSSSFDGETLRVTFSRKR